MINATQDHLSIRLSAAGNEKFMGLRCCAHIINIVCQEVLKFSKGPIGKIRQISKKLSLRGEKTEELKSLCNINRESYVSICTDCVTRWSSSYKMIESAYRSWIPGCYVRWYHVRNGVDAYKIRN